MFGAVVVGVGIAGWVRIRDMLAPLTGSPAERIAIKGFVSRRHLQHLPDVRQISLQDALSREDIQVAIICTENVSHEEYIRTFLQAGKHVCVEYPMTLDHRAAVELWQLAGEKGLVLHEEHIELLSGDYLELKRQVQGKELLGGSFHFTSGPLNPGFGFPSFAGIARLTQLVDLFGELSAITAVLEEDSDRNYMKMTVELMTFYGRPLTWIEERGPGLLRSKTINFQFDSCTLTQIPLAPKATVGLFMMDLCDFANKLLGQADPQQLLREKVRIFHCLKLAETIQQLCQVKKGGSSLDSG